jgi:2-methylcitrate dehydratase
LAKKSGDLVAMFAAFRHLKTLHNRVAPQVLQRSCRWREESIGCAIAALPGAQFKAPREQFDDCRGSRTCTLIGGGTTSPDQAALYNSGLVRYVNLLDS